MQSSQAPAPGTILLGKYQVERVLGQGGMGVVVAARHLVLDERVAMKFLLPEVAQNTDVVRRFLREAQSAVKIRSEHIARVIDVGTMETGQPYIVMEYLAGADLAEVLQRQGPLPMDHAVEYVLHACEALADAHSLGIVHRDIKPANLFLTTKNDGTPFIKVLDFGISKITGGDAQNLTRTRGMMGSPLYMSPEQLNSAKDVDHRVDVYALGVVLFELLTGRQPFEAEELPQLIVKILSVAPAQLRTYRMDLPPQLEEVINRCLAKNRDERFQSVAELAHALSPFASARALGSAERAARITQSRTNPNSISDGSQTSTLMPLGGTKPPTLSPRRSKAPLVFGAIAAVLLLGGGAFAAIQLGKTDDKPSSGSAKSDGAKTKGDGDEKGDKGSDKSDKSDKADKAAKKNDSDDKADEAKGEPSAKNDPKPETTTSTAETSSIAPKPTAALAPTGKPAATGAGAVATSTAKPKETATAKPSAKPKEDDPFGNHVY